MCTLCISGAQAQAQQPNFWPAPVTAPDGNHPQHSCKDPQAMVGLASPTIPATIVYTIPPTSLCFFLATEAVVAANLCMLQVLLLCLAASTAASVVTKGTIADDDAAVAATTQKQKSHGPKHYGENAPEQYDAPKHTTDKPYSSAYQHGPDRGPKTQPEKPYHKSDSSSYSEQTHDYHPKTSYHKHRYPRDDHPESSYPNSGYAHSEYLPPAYKGYTAMRATGNCSSARWHLY
jgi:hypothetical protein